MATASPRWTKTAFLAWFEEHRPQLLHLTAGLFGAELKTSGLTAEDALHEALERSVRKRHYRSCCTAMRTWFVKDIKWVILGALKQAERTVLLLDDDPVPDDSTSGDDVGRIEYAIASDEVDDGPAVWMDCDTLPPFIKSCTHHPEDAIPGRDCPAYRWASYQLDLRHRAARRRRIQRPGSRAFWPKDRAAFLSARRRRLYHDGEPGVSYSDDVWTTGQDPMIDPAFYSRAFTLGVEVRQTRLDALQVRDAVSRNAIPGGLARCSRKRACHPHAARPIVPAA